MQIMEIGRQVLDFFLSPLKTPEPPPPPPVEETTDYTYPLLVAGAATVLAGAVALKFFYNRLFAYNSASLSERTVTQKKSEQTISPKKVPTTQPPPKLSADEKKLVKACEEGELQTVNRLFENGVNIHVQDQTGTLLHIAATYGHFDVALFLIQKGLDPKATNNFKQTPLHFAAQNGHINFAEVLLDHKTEINAKTNLFITPIFRAVQHGKKEMVIFLLKKGADPNIPDKKGHTPLHMATMLGLGEIAEILIDGDVKVKTEIEIGGEKVVNTTVETLTDKKANIDAQDEEGQTPLHSAYRNNNKELIKLLESKGASKTIVDKAGKIPKKVAKPGNLAKLEKKGKKRITG